MSSCCRLFTVLILAVFVSCGQGQRSVAQEAVDETSIRQVWNRRQHEVQTASYQVTWIEITFDKRGSQRSQGAMDAAMAFDNKRFRFDIREGQSPPRMFVLDSDGLHAARPAPGGSDPDSNEASAKNVTQRSPWILAYPLLISHGLIPIPPLSCDGIMRTHATNGRERVVSSVPKIQSDKDFIWVDEKGYWSVRIESRDELVRNYHVYESNYKVLRIGITYRNLGKHTVADRFSIIWFAKSGKPSRRVDAKVTAVRLNNDLDAALFIPPRGRDELLKTLGKQWGRSLKVKGTMSLDEIARLLQQAFSDRLRVRVDQGAFHKPIEFNVGRLSFDSDTITIADLLLDKLQSRGLDFRFDTQGIMIIPRHVAWKYGELKAYASADFGMTIDVLRDTLYRSARPDEWDDVGGPASMMVDKDSGTVMVMHAQSEHIRLSRKLQQIVKEASK